jgi:uncharacterized protein (DUF2252 family)
MRQSITTATRQYETWLATYTPLVKADLALKHVLMKRDAFSFLRATFYRWRQVWPDVCADCVTAPVLRAIGDLHVENFGTWRDREGRLILGINDFDEAYPLPYTNDLVRLAVSAILAIDSTRLAITPTEAYDAILTGYTEGLKSGGQPYVCAGRAASVAAGHRDPHTPRPGGVLAENGIPAACEGNHFEKCTGSLGPSDAGTGAGL